MRREVRYNTGQRCTTLQLVEVVFRLRRVTSPAYVSLIDLDGDAVTIRMFFTSSRSHMNKCIELEVQWEHSHNKTLGTSISALLALKGSDIIW